MAATVATLMFLGGKSLSKADLDKVCQVLNIQQPPNGFPIGDDNTYYLVLSAHADVTKSPETSKPLMGLLGDAQG